MRRPQKQNITTGGAGYIADAPNLYKLGQLIKNNVYDYMFGNLPIDTVRQRLYDNITPFSYSSAITRAHNAVVNNKKESRYLGLKSDYFNPRDIIWATYLGIPYNKRHGNIRGNKLYESRYRPTLGGNNNSVYYTVPGVILTTTEKEDLIKDANGMYSRIFNIDYGPANRAKEERAALNFGESKRSNVLDKYFATHTISRGVDSNKGEYISYYDLWDISPNSGPGGKDESRGIGTPIQFYDRLYLDEFYGADSSARKGTYYGGWLPEIIIRPPKG